MKQGISFIDLSNEINVFHTGKDLDLVIESAVIAPPEPRTEFLEIPYRDGSIDLTEVNGEAFIRYKDRTMTISIVDVSQSYRYGDRIMKLSSYILGKRRKIILDRDPGHYYLGRVISISEPQRDVTFDRATVTCFVEPFRYELNTSSEDWLWDPFDFENGIINEGKLTVSGSLSTWFDVGDKVQVPVITCSNTMILTLNGKNYTLSSGRNYDPDIMFLPGINNVTFRGSGTVTVDFRRSIF